MSGIMLATASIGNASAPSGSPFTPDGGAISRAGVLSASATLNCSSAAVWTYSTTSATPSGYAGTVNIASGSSATSVTFGTTASGTGSNRGERSVTWAVTGVSGGVTRNFTVTCDSVGNQ